MQILAYHEFNCHFYLIKFGKKLQRIIEHHKTINAVGNALTIEVKDFQLIDSVSMVSEIFLNHCLLALLIDR